MARRELFARPATVNGPRDKGNTMRAFRIFAGCVLIGGLAIFVAYLLLTIPFWASNYDAVRLMFYVACASLLAVILAERVAILTRETGECRKDKSKIC